MASILAGAARAGGVALAVLLVCACGCTNLGASTMPQNRFDYSAALGESWKRQTLLNIVKMRYLDPPTFVDVGQIISAYQLEVAANAGATIPTHDTVRGGSASLGGAVRYTDKPTITYTPLTGDRFLRALMTPLPPASVFFMIQSGWPADSVLGASVAVMNGLRNHAATTDGVTQADPGFTRALELLRRIQLSGAVALRVKQDEKKQETTILTLRTKEVSAETRADIAELRRLLRLDLDATEHVLVFGATSSGGQEVAVLTRSLIHIIGMMATQVEVPPEHVSEGRATPGAVSSADGSGEAAGSPGKPARIRIRSSAGEPADAFVAIPYRDHWYWIDDRDLQSKRAFAFMMMLFTLAGTGEKESLPLVTIQAQ